MDKTLTNALEPVWSKMASIKNPAIKNTRWWMEEDETQFILNTKAGNKIVIRVTRQHEDTAIVHIMAIKDDKVRSYSKYNINSLVDFGPSAWYDVFHRDIQRMLKNKAIVEGK